MEITIENFYIKSEGVFNHITSIPKNFKSFFKSKGSEYFTNEDKSKLIRVSNHWGFKIKKCNWLLHNFKVCACKNWKQLYGDSFYIGIIDVAELNTY